MPKGSCGFRAISTGLMRGHLKNLTLLVSCYTFINISLSQTIQVFMLSLSIKTVMFNKNDVLAKVMQDLPLVLYFLPDYSSDDNS